MTRAATPDGKILHAEVHIGDSLVMLNDAAMGGKSPKAMGGSPASLWVYRTIATHKEDLSREEMAQRQAQWMRQMAPPADTRHTAMR